MRQSSGRQGRQEGACGIDIVQVIGFVIEEVSEALAVVRVLQQTD